MSPDIASVFEFDLAAGPFDHDARLDCWRRVEGSVGIDFERHTIAAPPSLVLRDEELALHIVETPGKRFTAEAAEDDGEGRPDPGAGEHRHRKLRDHAHVDPDVGAFLDPQLLQAVGKPDHLALEFAEGDLAAIVIWLAFPEIGNLVLVAMLHMPVDAVVANVELPADIPLCVRRLPLVQLLPGLEPGDAFRLLGPELVETPLVDVRLRVGLPAELC